MPYITGPAKHPSEIILQDKLEHPIWQTALGSETEEFHDETWEEPIISTKEVMPEMISPIITLQVKGKNIFGAGTYEDERSSVEGIAIWEDEGWVCLESSEELRPPLVFVALPKIRGIAEMEFVWKDETSGDAFLQKTA